MGLDDRALALAALNDVWIDGALHQKVHRADLFRLFFKDVDELRADDLALLLGVGDARKFRKEAIGGVRFDEVHAQPVAEYGHDLLRLVLAVQTVIDEHADELTADRPMDERRGDGGIDAARHGAEHLFVPHLAPDLFDLFGDKAAHRPVALGAADFVEEILQNLVAVLGVDDLGVKLHAVDALFLAPVHRNGAGLCGSEHFKARRNLRDVIGMAHPADAALRDILGERTRLDEGEGPFAVLAGRGMLYFTSQRVGDELAAIADAEHGNAELQDRGIDMGRTRVVHAVGAAREDDADGIVRLDLLHRHVAGL